MKKWIFGVVFPSPDRVGGGKLQHAARGQAAARALRDLLADPELADQFNHATMFIYRLCPADYHRFHFPEDCMPGFPAKLDGPLHSVNPVALSTGLRILDTNYRHRTILETSSGRGSLAMMEIGAMCVGSVVQTYVPMVPAKRGQEKGMFRFGGSTVIVLYPPERIQADQDILAHSREGIETYVKLGMPVGRER